MPAPTRIACPRLVLVLVAAVVCLVLAAFPRPAGAAEPGVVSDLTWGLTRTDVDRSVGLMQEAGVRWIRFNVSWKAGEQFGKGQINEGYFASVDYALAKAQAAGIKIVMPIADDVPYWASADPAKHVAADGSKRWNINYKPTSFADYADFAAYVANRYKTKGVHVYEVWNEPNLARFWPSGVDAADYVRMLKAAYPAIKQADPQATVLSAGLSKNDYRYVERMYAAGAGQYLDGFGIHPYSGNPDACWNDSTGRKAVDAFCAIEEVRNVMVANGDGHKDLWATELGWSTCDNAAAGCWNSGVTEAQQAAYLTRAYAIMAARYPWVKVALLYNLRNNYWLHDDARDWEANLGLLRTDFSRKPAFAAFKAVAQGTAPVSDVPAPTAPEPAPAQSPAPAPTTTTNTAPVSATTPTTAPTSTTVPTTSTAPATTTAPTSTTAPTTTTTTTTTKTKRKRRQATLSIQLRTTLAARARVRVRGRVFLRGARSVTVRMERKSGRRWVSVSRRAVPVRGGGYVATLSGRGRGRGLRVRAEATGARAAVARSRYLAVPAA